MKDAQSKLDEYGGVFVSDVVGLGKTYISAMLAQQVDGRNLVIAPPVLLDRYRPGSWPNVFSDFRVAADFESIGKLDKLVQQGTDKYKNIFIDETHRFRTETNVTYEQLARICRGKRVILVTATPLNNTPTDILSQIKLFQNTVFDCGCGRLAWQLLQQNPRPRRYVGIDVHKGMIIYPFEYLKEWVYENRAWNELYMLRAFLEYNAAFQIVAFNTFLEHFHAEYFAEKMPLCIKNTGGSLWLRKCG